MSSVFSASNAWAQVSSGKMTGKVIDLVTKQAQADVVVTATSPALQGEQVVVTDASGEYEFPVLPAGTYLVHLEKDGYKPYNQGGLEVHIDKTIRIVISLIPENAAVKAEEVVVVGKPPTVDVGSTQAGTTITSDFLNNIPVDNPNAGFGVRSFESLATTAPGANADSYGVSISGSSAPENNYTIDGVNVTDPSYGLLGSALSIDFIKEVDIITGGYNAEYGRATGGVENVITKAGGNEYHGDFRLDVMPGTALSPKVAVPFGQGVTGVSQPTLVGDIGADVGGYILKDKLWFFAGIEPSVEQQTITRTINAVTYQQGCPVYGTPASPGAAPPIISYSASNQNCDASLKGNAVDNSGNPLVASTTPINNSSTQQRQTQFATQYFAKLTYLLNQNQSFNISAWGNPRTQDGPQVPTGGLLSGVVNATDSSTDEHEVANTGDYKLGWDGAFFDKHVLVTASVGLHHDDDTNTPTNGAELADPSVLWTNTHSLTEFDPSVAKYCGANDAALGSTGLGNAPGTGFYRCPVTNYLTGGPGYLDDGVINNYQAKLAVTNLFRAFGHHEVKYGLDYNTIDWTHTKTYTGQFAIEEIAGAPGTFFDSRGFGYLAGPNQPVLESLVTSKSITSDLAGFLQDSYRVADLFTLNLGLRWEDQQMFQDNGQNIINLPNEVMPRIGLIYDWTGQGRSKIYADYAIFYEDIPLDIIDRGYPAEQQVGVSRNSTPYSPCDPRIQSQAIGICNQPGSVSGTWFNTGSAVEPIDPKLQGQSVTEAQIGTEYEVFEDARAGLFYTHRNYNNVIEDMSTDAANTYFIANPGSGLAAQLPVAQRNYDALNVYVNKTFSHHWMVDAKYTLSRLYGNYAGLIQYEYEQLDPNITSAFDLPQLIKNQTGPLPNDHTHQVKIYLARDIPLSGASSVTLGGSYTGLSGAPESYLGADYLYGPGAVMVLPRGEAGRLPWTHDIDASIKYNYHLTESNVLTASVDVFNIFHFQAVTSVDQNYTFNNVYPIINGTPAQLSNLRSVNPVNGPVAVNPDFLRPQSYQAPLTVRFGLKLTF